VNLFLDANVVLAACGRATGASRAIFDLAARNAWILQTSDYIVAEVTVNLPRLVPSATHDWTQLRQRLVFVCDVWTWDRPAIFSPAKDRPVLFTAAAWAQVLVTLDRNDFGPVMNGQFYGLDVITPGNFLERERSSGRLKN
jgi:predicted nucleic acid-binding protein